MKKLKIKKAIIVDGLDRWLLLEFEGCSKKLCIRLGSKFCDKLIDYAKKQKVSNVNNSMELVGVEIYVVDLPEISTLDVKWE